MSLNFFMFQKNEAEYKTIKELRGIKPYFTEPAFDGLSL
jgi:hypothetical protein